jgi:hypothetical protein
MAKKHRYTQTQVIAALHSCRGMVFLAARRLQCSPQTIMNYCEKYPAVEQAKHDARGELLDVAEVKLWQAVQEGQHWAICFALRTLGKERGYSETISLHLTIERAASIVAGQFGLSAAAVLAEAQLLLEECDRAT